MSGRTIIYPLYGAIPVKNGLHMRTTHESAQVTQKLSFIIILKAFTWNAKRFLWIKNVMYEHIATTTLEM